MVRKGEEDEDFSKRSNNTAKTPPGGAGGEDMDVKGLLRGIREEMREGLRGVREEIREVAKGQKEVMMEEVKKIKSELREREERWRRKRGELQKRIEDMERKLEGMQMEVKGGGLGGGRGREESGGGLREEGRGEADWKERVKRLERRYEVKERGERRRNILIKGVKEDAGGIKGGVAEVMKKLGVEVKIEEIRKIEAGRREKGGMALVKVGSEEEKAKIMRNKWKLRDENTWIDEDLTWEERRIKWKINQVAWKARGEGKRVRIGMGRVWIEGEWWVWDEVRGVLRNGRERCWEEGQGKGKESEREEEQRQGK
ncbi:uncharacterized protein LOC143906545 isoform X2 [Temnothorax americanus]|uniref:uncharacterized protein LOC143906545 isoform X2 n=1 Tax=Temnothorax americanus TaxID=1964332 RepID=UPI004068E70F